VLGEAQRSFAEAQRRGDNDFCDRLDDRGHYPAPSDDGEKLSRRLCGEAEGKRN
jgi:hypothetical protein